METFNVNLAAAAQKKFCAENDYPHFAPNSGVCYVCKRNIYTPLDRGSYKTGISVERASSILVTGCPHCNRSYCD